MSKIPQSQPILVSGASGFLGRAVVRALADMGQSVRALVRRPERGAALAELSTVTLVQGDILDGERMMSVVDGCGTVIHCAAALFGGREVSRRTNVDGTVLLARAAAAHGARFVHISSMLVYGYGVRGDVRESAPLAPANDHYSRSKADAEIALRELAAETGLPYTIIRPGAIYGPGARLWTGFMFRLANRRPLLFPGSGRGSIPAIFVDDVVRLIIRAAEDEAATGQAFHATPQPAPTCREFLLAYAALAGGNRWFGLPMPLAKLAARVASISAPKGSMRALLPDILDYVNRVVCYRNDLARERLGWQPQVSLAEGVERCRPWLEERQLLDQPTGEGPESA